MAADPPKYRFGPLERRGLIAGWRGGQIAVIAAGLVVGVVALRAHPDPIGVIAAVLALGSSLAVACWPLGGRTGEEWLPTVVRWGTDGVVGRRRRSPSPGAGHCPGNDGPVPCGLGDGSRRSGGGHRSVVGSMGAFGGLVVLGADAGPGSGDTEVGVVHDTRAGTFTGVLALEGHSFALLGSDEKERRVAGWAGVLAALAREGSSVHRIQWLAVAHPDDGRAVHSYLADRAVEPNASAAHASYAELLDEAGADTSRHAVLAAVQVHPGKAAYRSSPRGDASVSVLLRELENVRRLVTDADISCLGVLDPAALAATIRALGQTDPPAVLDTDASRREPPGLRTCPPCLVGAPWPMATEVEWDRVRTDGNWHATYWIAEWPRVDVGPDFLAPLLLGPLRRSVGVVMEPISPSRAIRAVEQARTADIADSELRRRGGFLSTARRAREAELVVRRESELADGHGSYRFSGYVTVTAPSASQLEEWCEMTEHAAGQARLELRRLFGDQERALLCTLPLCRGLS
jgi:hypothetical protein